MTRRKERSIGAAPAFLPLKAAETWNALLDEVRRCLRDDNRPRGRFNDLVEALRQRDYPWPTRGRCDEFLLGGFLSDVMAFSLAGPTRRPWVAKWLADKVELVEGMVDDTTLDADADYLHARQLEPPQPLKTAAEAWKAPEPGQPGYRRDIDG